MGKAYPLEIENWGDDVYTLASRGHHDFVEFMKAVKEHYPDWPMGKPEHLWMKASPCGPNCGNHTCHYVVSEKGRRGAFPVTYTREDYGNPYTLPTPHPDVHVQGLPDAKGQVHSP